MRQIVLPRAICRMTLTLSISHQLISKLLSRYIGHCARIILAVNQSQWNISFFNLNWSIRDRERGIDTSAKPHGKILSQLLL